MIDEFSSEEGQNSIFESFSDIALCTLAVALLLVTLLAINITQNLSVKVNRSTFSGGVMRPSLHLECTVPDFGKTSSEEWAVERLLFEGYPYVAVHLFGPSLALITTDVQEGGTVALGKNETFMQQQDLSLYQFMQLVPGIDPGSFEVDGRPTSLLLSSILDKQMVYEPNVAGGYRVNADERLARRVLALLWPVYAYPSFPVRRPAEYSHARTRVFVETKTGQGVDGEEHYIVIGHVTYRLPDALEDGSLAWLGGFSSGLTEVVFLGETWADPKRRTNKRIDFFEKEGFVACANAYREDVFPIDGTPAEDTIKAALVKVGYPEERAGRRASDALAQRRVSGVLLADRLVENVDVILPPLLAYPKAWAAYIQHYEKEQPDPPKWFYAEFLDRLGFDRLTIEELSL